MTLNSKKEGGSVKFMGSKKLLGLRWKEMEWKTGIR